MEKNIIYKSYIHYWDAAIYSPYFFTSAEAVDWMDDLVSKNNWSTISYGDIKIKKAELIIKELKTPSISTNNHEQNVHSLMCTCNGKIQT